MGEIISNGQHILLHGNILDGRIEKALTEVFPNGVDWCYTDPPWGTGNLNYWKTMNKKMTGAEVEQFNQNDLEEYIVKLICGYVKDYAFIGVGYYLKILDSYGYRVIGNELNAARLQKAIANIS